MTETYMILYGSKESSDIAAEIFCANSDGIVTYAVVYYVNIDIRFHSADGGVCTDYIWRGKSVPDGAVIYDEAAFSAHISARRAG